MGSSMHNIDLVSGWVREVYGLLEADLRAKHSANEFLTSRPECVHLGSNSRTCLSWSSEEARSQSRLHIVLRASGRGSTGFLPIRRWTNSRCWVKTFER